MRIKQLHEYRIRFMIERFHNLNIIESQMEVVDVKKTSYISSIEERPFF